MLGTTQFTELTLTDADIAAEWATAFPDEEPATKPHILTVAELARLIQDDELGHVFGALDRDGGGLMHRSYLATHFTCIDSRTADEVGQWLSLPVRPAVGCRNN